ncbi:hypothetical protein LX36DRAFT_591221 [Colletotrichum falcatum]|nr:hypothetical protein LX36DRAFT_591221 [Colletotrichum falcatum]
MDPDPFQYTDKPDLSKGEDELVELHPDGDVVLVVGDHKYDLQRQLLIHSKVLAIASPCFATLFGSVFQEGRTAKQESFPRIKLEEDDAGGMKVILYLLHFKSKDEYKNIEPRVLPLIARASDKYGCSTALSPWIFRWLHDTPEPSSPDEHGYLLVAAYLFGATDHWRSISTKAVKQMAPALGRRGRITKSYPFCLNISKRKEALEKEISSKLDLLQDEMGKVEGVLQSDVAAYKKDPLLCLECGRLHPGGSKQCQPCKNMSLHGSFCTAQSRVAEDFDILRRNELWPSVAPFRTGTITSIGNQLSGLNLDKHWCGAGPICPLKVNVYSLSTRTNRIIRNIEGINMKDDSALA